MPRPKAYDPSSGPIKKVSGPIRERSRHDTRAWATSTPTGASAELVVANPRYTGRQIWNRQHIQYRHTDDGRVRVQQWNPTDQWVVSTRPAHPALVSDTDFIAVQAIRSTRTATDGSPRTRAATSAADPRTGTGSSMLDHTPTPPTPRGADACSAWTPTFVKHLDTGSIAPFAAVTVVIAKLGGSVVLSLFREANASGRAVIVPERRSERRGLSRQARHDWTIGLSSAAIGAAVACAAAWWQIKVTGPSCPSGRRPRPPTRQAHPPSGTPSPRLGCA
jgi:hypothetical protein